MFKLKSKPNPRCVKGATIHVQSASIFCKKDNDWIFGMEADRMLLAGKVNQVVTLKLVNGSNMRYINASFKYRGGLKRTARISLSQVKAGPALDHNYVKTTLTHMPHGFVSMMQVIVHDGPDDTIGWCDDQTEFVFGLDLLLDGLEARRLEELEKTG